MIIVSNPAPPLDTDFNGGTVIVVTEKTSKVAGITSNGDKVIIVTEDSDENLLGLIGLAISSTECEIVMYTQESSEEFYEAQGKCSLKEDGRVFRLEQVVYAGKTLDLKGELEEEVSLKYDSMDNDTSHSEITEDILEFQGDILEKLEVREKL